MGPQMRPLNKASLTRDGLDATLADRVRSPTNGLLALFPAREKCLPRYDYECQTCHNHFEIKQSFVSEPVATCPVCHNGARRVIHSVPVVFKGSGFYVNDYGKGSGSTGARSDVKESKKDSKSEKESTSGPEPESGSSSKSKPKKEPTSAK